MSQELVQVKKQLTFEEICPQHSAALSRWDELTKEERDREHTLLCDCACCFVGEAHGGFNYHKCFKCMRFATFSEDGLCGAFIEYNICKPDWESFELRKAEFVKHFNECHVTLTGPPER